jgi:DNA-binding CsgD family transcriptional regulator
MKIDPNMAALASDSQKGLTKREYFVAMLLMGGQTEPSYILNIVDRLIAELNKSEEKK